MKKIIFLLIGVVLSTYLPAQYFDLGQDPSSIKWRQINTPHFQLIFPEGYDHQVQELAKKLELVLPHEMYSLSSHPRKLPVIIHTHTMKANGVVPWAPRRMEIFTYTPQNTCAQPWLDQLVLHETRHLVQIEKVNQGVTKFLTYLFGEQATAGIIGAFVPFWFLEGDATVTETALSKSGRGRVPSFTMPLRTQVLTYDAYSYDKAVFGSYKNFVPDWYILGYHLVGASRIKYGTKLWDSTLNTVAKRPYLLAPFSIGIKRATGLSKTNLYHQMLKELDSTWLEQLKQQPLSPFKVISPTPSATTFTSYLNASWINDNTVFARKSSMDDIDRFVLIDSTGQKTTIHTPGFYFNEKISYSKGKITWAEKRYDPRWNNRSYSVIKTVDIRTGKVKQLTNKSRLSAPDLSHDGNLIVAVKQTVLDEYSLVILDASDGSVIRKLANPDNLFFITPIWTTEDTSIVAIAMNANGKSIVSINLQTERITEMLPFSFVEIEQPFVYENWILFTGAYTKIDNIFALNTKTKRLHQVTSAPFGATGANVSGEFTTLYYSNYTANGYEIVKTAFNPELCPAFSKPPPCLFNLADSLTNQETFILSEQAVDAKDYAVKPYRGWQHLFNFHSWAPVSINVDNQTFKPGISLFSQNKLSNTFFSLGYEYNLNESTDKFYTKLSYRKYFPVFDISYDYGNRASSYINDDGLTEPFTWKESNLTGTISVPLSFTINKWMLGFRPFLTTTRIDIWHNESTPDDFTSGPVQTMEYRFFGYGQIKSSYRDLYPKWGIIFDLNYRNTPFDGEPLGTVGSIETSIYFPGIFRHHGFKLYTGLQKKQKEKYYFPDLINYPRGYTGLSFDQVYSFSLNYKFPLLYPDLSLGPILFIKRVKTTLFYDHAIATTNNETIDFNSIGIDLTADMHILRFLAPFDLGLRTIYKPQSDSFAFEFLFALDINALYKNPGFHSTQTFPLRRD